MKKYIPAIAVATCCLLTLVGISGCGDTDPNADVSPENVAPTSQEEMQKEMDEDPQYAEEMKKMQQGQ